ncbi:MAG: TRAP transporter small permease subunit, partial [Dehalococcoidales bacterium]|nr:TRAP transporter small permease subunit [Dehalococcoidales bacterium]
MKVLRFLSKLVDVLTDVLSITYGSLLFVTALLIGYEVIVRKFFHISIDWIYAFSALFTTSLYPYFTAPVAVRALRFIRIDVAERKLAPYTRKWTEAYAYVVFLAVGLLLAILYTKYISA